MTKHFKRNNLIIRASFLVGTSILCLNINAIHLSASSKPSAMLIGETSDLTLNDLEETPVPRAALASTVSWVDSSDEELVQVSSLWEEQLMDILMNDSPKDSVKVCQTFYTEKDYEALTLPQISVTQGTALRYSPREEGTVITTFNSVTTATLLFRYKEWCYVELSGTYRGYIPAETADLSTLTEDQLTQLDLVNKCRYGGIVNSPASSGLNLREQPDSESNLLGKVTTGTILEIIGYCDNGWYKVNSSYGEAYVNGDYLSIDRYLECEVDEDGYIRSVHEELIARQRAESIRQLAALQQQAAAGSTNGTSIAQYALEFLGTPYVFGGTTPSGFDCSGLVYYVYSHFGLSVPRGAGSQYSRCRTIAMSDLQPGDLIFFSSDYSSGLEHVGIYIGNGQFVHAPYSGDVVKVNNLSDSWYSANYYASGSFLH